MIKQVIIHNFESHKDTTVDWDKGFNILSGESGKGKSSIRRAIAWVTTNRPSGKKYVNWDCIDKKGNIKDTVSVTLIMDNGNKVTRIRSPTINGYIINDGKPLEAVGTDVPDDVQKALNFTDVNCQKQFDRPFLLDMSAGDVAKYINKLVHIEDADIYQAKIKSMRDYNKKAIKNLSSTLENEQKELEKFAWLDTANTLITTCTTNEEVIESKKEAISDIDMSKHLFERFNKELIIYGCSTVANKCIKTIDNIANNKVFDDLEAINKDIAELESKENTLKSLTFIEKCANIINVIENNNVDAKKKELMEMNNTIRMYKHTENTLNGIPNVQQVQSLIKVIDITYNNIQKESITNMTSYINSVKENVNTLSRIKKELKPINEELNSIKVCPLCGKEL